MEQLYDIARLLVIVAAIGMTLYFLALVVNLRRDD
jgi:hypothetical protein